MGGILGRWNYGGHWLECERAARSRVRRAVGRVSCRQGRAGHVKCLSDGVGYEWGRTAPCAGGWRASRDVLRLTEDNCVLNLAGSFSSPAIEEILSQHFSAGCAPNLQRAVKPQHKAMHA